MKGKSRLRTLRAGIVDRWFPDVVAERVDLAVKVIDDEYWVAQGTMLKDGALFGQVQFDAPVVEGTGGPDLVLHLTTGEDILLHTLID